MPRLKKNSSVLLWSIAGLAAFLLWQAWELHRYIQADTLPPAWDQAVHLEISLDYLNAIRAGHWSDLLYLAPKPGMPPFPPLYHLELIPFYAASNPVSAALWLNWIYLAILSAAIFAIAYDFLQSERALAAAVMFAGAPAVQWLLHNQLIDLALAAWSAAAYSALFRSDGFRKRGASLGFGALFAIGMLHKWSFFSYMIPAYYLAAIEWRDKKCRRNIAQAAGLAAALCFPWYWAHLPVLPARLTQASSDMATPVWKGAAFLAYFSGMIGDFGLPFWMLAWAGLMLRHYKNKPHFAWLLPAWVLSSYLFWAIVPNRQMRFLLPGLPAMAVLACSSFPKPVVWLAAVFQLLTAANYPRGFIPRTAFSVLGAQVSFFESSPPAHEDWKVTDILREADKLRDPDRAVSNLTLIANAQYFNPPTFAWAAKYAAPRIHIRGVNRRLCEFSEFVVLKTGVLGPSGVIGGLPEAAEIAGKSGDWFARSYESAAQWNLPDGSTAVLFRQRRLKVPPFHQRRYVFNSYRQDPLIADGLKIKFGAWRPADSAYDWIRVSAAAAELRQFNLSGLDLELRDALIVPAGLSPEKNPWQEIRFLKMKEFRIRSLRVTAADLKAFLEKRARGLEVLRVGMDGALQVSARFKGVPLYAEAEAALNPEGDELDITARKIKIGGVPLPLFLLQRFKTFRVPLTPNPEMPFKIDIPILKLGNGELRIG